MRSRRLAHGRSGRRGCSDLRGNKLRDFVLEDFLRLALQLEELCAAALRMRGAAGARSAGGAQVARQQLAALRHAHDRVARDDDVRACSFHCRAARPRVRCCRRAVVRSDLSANAIGKIEIRSAAQLTSLYHPLCGTLARTPARARSCAPATAVLRVCV